MEGHVLKSLTDNFVLPSPALLKSSLNLINRSESQLFVLSRISEQRDKIAQDIDPVAPTRYLSEISNP